MYETIQQYTLNGCTIRYNCLAELVPCHYVAHSSFVRECAICELFVLYSHLGINTKLYVEYSTDNKVQKACNTTLVVYCHGEMIDLITYPQFLCFLFLDNYFGGDIFLFIPKYILLPQINEADHEKHPTIGLDGHPINLTAVQG